MNQKSIIDMSLTHLSLFSGIGGLDLAAEWAGFQTVGQCEWADYPTKVLEKHWPDVPRWRDIRTLTGGSFYERTGLRKVDVVSGGFPCQPHSLSGKRLASHDERDLWSELFRVFCETNAKWLVGENVPGLLSSENGRFFGRVLRDLAQVGCHVWWYCFPAHAVGAKFWGERIALVATADSKRFLRRESCVGCIYHRSLSDCSQGLPGCHYCLDTGNPRGCSSVKCDKKKLGKCDSRTNPFDARLGRANE